ncbi:NAD-dependent epimerase/dehydratase family protein [Candidatus Dojkabacteria bacterium]|nr:NAD-dependent epimerase/dehydratase family protein [Candidatus Dojkabacteria bacterium]
MSRILITGGAGFIGSSIAISYKKEHPDSTIVCLDNLRRRGSELALPRLKKYDIAFTHGDVRTPEDLEFDEHFDAVIECSAEPSVLAGLNGSPGYVINCNLVGAVNCLELCRKHSADLVFLSTSRVYPYGALQDIPLREGATRFSLQPSALKQGISEQGINEDFPLQGPRSIYGATKLSAEHLITEYCAAYGMKAIINRCGVVAGPWQMGKVDQGVVALWVARHAFGGPLSYIGFGGKGKQVRDILHVDDLCALIEQQLSHLSTEKKGNCSLYTVGGGINNAVSLQELSSICEQITETTIEIGSIPETRPADIPWYVTDSSRASRDFSWTPTRRILDIVKNIYEWLKEDVKKYREIFQ